MLFLVIIFVCYISVLVIVRRVVPASKRKMYRGTLFFVEVAITAVPILAIAGWRSWDLVGPGSAATVSDADIVEPSVSLFCVASVVALILFPVERWRARKRDRAEKGV